MKLLTQKFDLVATGWIGVGYGFITRRWINLMFEIPKDTRTIWVVVHTRDAKCRAKAKVGRGEWSDRSWISTPTSSVWISSRSLTRILKPYIGKTVYLECWYE